MVPGQVEEVVYLGTDTSNLVRGKHGDIVQVRQQNEDALAVEPAHQVGDEVYLSWQPTGGRLITR